MKNGVRYLVALTPSIVKYFIIWRQYWLFKTGSYINKVFIDQLRQIRFICYQFFPWFNVYVSLTCVSFSSSLKSFQIQRGSDFPSSILDWYVSCLATSVNLETLLRRYLYSSILPLSLHLFLSFMQSIISGVNQSGWYFFFILWLLIGACLSSTSINRAFQTETMSSTVS